MEKISGFYLFLLKAGALGAFTGGCVSFALAYLDLLQGAVLVIFAVIFTFVYGAADGAVGGRIVVKHGFNLLQ